MHILQSNRVIQLIRSLTFFLLLLTFPILSHAQEQSVEMADTLRQEGKIYVVVVSLLVIVLGLVLFLIRIDGKLNRMEKQNFMKP
jgi:hypothetical protein